MTATPAIAELEKLIQPAKIAEQGLLTPTRVIMDDEEVFPGEPGYKITLVYPDDIPEETWFDHQKTEPVRRWVYKTIWRADGEERFPAVHFLRESELQADAG